MEMIERVARACHAAIEETMPARVRQSWDAITPLAKAAMFVRARAQIEAMREPTEAMIEAQLSLCVFPRNAAGEAERAEQAWALREAWGTMIHAALTAAAAPEPILAKQHA